MTDFDFSKIADYKLDETVVEIPRRDELSAIRECIADIEEQIEGRLSLHKKLMSDLDKSETQVSTFLTQVSVGSEFGREQMLLFKSKEIEIAEAKRAEQASCWQDVARLKEELRRYRRELSEKESRVSMLDRILSK